MTTSDFLLFCKYIEKQGMVKVSSVLLFFLYDFLVDRLFLVKRKKATLQSFSMASMKPMGRMQSGLLGTILKKWGVACVTQLLRRHKQWQRIHCSGELQGFLQRISKRACLCFLLN